MRSLLGIVSEGGSDGDAVLLMLAEKPVGVQEATVVDDDNDVVDFGVDVELVVDPLFGTRVVSVSWIVEVTICLEVDTVRGSLPDEELVTIVLGFMWLMLLLLLLLLLIAMVVDVVAVVVDSFGPSSSLLSRMYTET